MIPLDMTDEQLIGRRVEISCTYTMLFGKKGTIAYISSGQVQVTLDGESHATFWNKTELDLIPEDEESRRRRTSDGCECGSSAVGSPRHSYYCKLYRDWEDIQ